MNDGFLAAVRGEIGVGTQNGLGVEQLTISCQVEQHSQFESQNLLQNPARSSPLDIVWEGGQRIFHSSSFLHIRDLYLDVLHRIMFFVQRNKNSANLFC